MKIWNIKKQTKEGGSILECLLNSRGIEEREREDFLNPLKCSLSSPYVFSDMKKAVLRIEKAVKNNELILVWGDFDADGVTSASILHKTLKHLKANFDCVIPDREKMGHGLNTKFLLPYISKHKPKVLITVDCGISNEKEVSLIKNFGVDVIITDHHKAPDNLPDAYAIINPKAQNSLDENLDIAQIKKISDLAGAGVSYKLASALLENDNCDALKDELLVLACIGTIADVVPLLYENRTIAAKGLELINNGVHKGVQLLFSKNTKDGKVQNISSYDAAFILAPRINAAGRLATAESAFKLLTDEDDGVLAAALRELENYNRIRQNLCDKITLEAMDEAAKDPNTAKHKAIILFNEDWHVGVIGIVASKLVERFNKPVFLVTKDDNNMARCSIRGTKDYSITEILDRNAELFTGGYGGHSLAGGFSFDLNKTTFETVKNALLDTFDTLEEHPVSASSVDIDMVIEPDDINDDLMKTIDLLEPTGQDNPPPVFALKDVALVSKKALGKEGKHISFIAKKGDKSLGCIWWGHNEIPVGPDEKFDIAFKPKVNIFNNERSIRLYTVDLISETAAKSRDEGVKFYDHRMKNGILNGIEEYVKRPNVDIDIFARKLSTKAALKDYPAITARITNNFRACDIMFFDYPASREELAELLNKRSGKVHLMREDFSENIEDYIKQLIGMLKYATNNRDGEISITNIAGATGMSESFIQSALDILEDIHSIEIQDIDKIRFLTPPHLDNFYSHSDFKALNAEFNNVIEFKKYIARVAPDDIKNIL